MTRALPAKVIKLKFTKLTTATVAKSADLMWGTSIYHTAKGPRNKRTTHVIEMIAAPIRLNDFSKSVESKPSLNIITTENCHVIAKIAKYRGRYVTMERTFAARPLLPSNRIDMKIILPAKKKIHDPLITYAC